VRIKRPLKPNGIPSKKASSGNYCVWCRSLSHNMVCN